VKTVHTRGLVTALATAVALAAPVQAQTIAGVVLDEARESPVAGALILLLDRSGEERAQALSDPDGRFVITPPEAGEYYLAATRIGYEPTRSPLLALTMEGTAPLELMMRPAPIGLEGFEVEVDAEGRAAEELRFSGVEPRDLGSRFVSQAEIAAVQIRPDVGSVLEHQAISGMRVIRPENLNPGSADVGLCVSLQRARRGNGMGTCAMVVLDGVPIRGDVALALDPESVAAMAVLLPTEATTMYGTRGARGALLIWTRGGGR
jgi:hypothetical protein